MECECNEIYKKLNLKWNRLTVQMVLLTLIVVAMVGFVSVTIIIINVLRELNINPSDKIIQIFMNKIAFINVSMIVLFTLIVLLLSRVFKKINNYAFYSCTTGLPNKNYMLNNLHKKITGKGEFAALISLDMDDFKAVNDTMGHMAGDELLKQAAARFETVIQEQDCVCHIGGDEFLFFIKSVKLESEVDQLAKDILSLFTEPFFINGSHIDYVSCSLGML